MLRTKVGGWQRPSAADSRKRSRSKSLDHFCDFRGRQPSAPCHTLDVDPRAILDIIGAPTRLRVHGALVCEAADALLAKARTMDIAVDETWVRGGAWLHDAGKAVHRDELEAPGHRHEAAGETLLLSHGVDARVARCCVTHASFSATCSLEELLVALADKLWKGVRNEALETLVIDAIAMRGKRERWDVFVELDACFEQIASDGDARLQRSVRRD